MPDLTLTPKSIRQYLQQAGFPLRAPSERVYVHRTGKIFISLCEAERTIAARKFLATLPFHVEEGATTHGYHFIISAKKEDQ